MKEPPYAHRTPEYLAAYDKWQAKWRDRIEQFYVEFVCGDDLPWKREYNQEQPYVCPHCKRVIPVKKIKHVDSFYQPTLLRAIAPSIRCAWGCAKCVRALEARLRKQFVRKCFYCHNIYLKFQSGFDCICPNCLTDDIKREATVVQDHRNRAQTIGEDDSLNIIEWMQTLRDFKFHCAYCTAGFYECLEHFIPLGKGRGTMVNNCVPACQRCNSIKKNHHPLKDAKMFWGMDITGVDRYLRKRKRARI